MNPIIDVKHLGFSYQNRPLFNDLCFTVNSGDFVAMIGSNGTGKSTLLKLILGELQLQQGAIEILGTPVGQMKQWQRIGYVPQKNVLTSSGCPATVREVVQANLYAQIGLFGFAKKVHRDKTMQALQLVDMAAASDQLIGNLSGGQQQRVMIARALVNDPVLLLLDEPTTGIDTATTTALYNLLQDLNKKLGITIFMVTHDIRRSTQYVNRTFCLEEGSLVELNEAQLREELAHKHTHPVAREGLRDGGSAAFDCNNAADRYNAAAMCEPECAEERSHGNV
jgi:zinc transport system ATP-binding protein